MASLDGVPSRMPSFGVELMSQLATFPGSGSEAEKLTLRLVGKWGRGQAQDTLPGTLNNRLGEMTNRWRTSNGLAVASVLRAKKATPCGGAQQLAIPVAIASTVAMPP